MGSLDERRLKRRIMGRVVLHHRRDARPAMNAAVSGEWTARAKNAGLTAYQPQ